MPCLKFHWLQLAISNMFALRIAEHLDAVEDILSCVVSGFLAFAHDAFALQEVEEAFGKGVVITVASPAH